MNRISSAEDPLRNPESLLTAPHPAKTHSHPTVDLGVIVEDISEAHLDTLNLSEHRHNNLLDEKPRLSPKVLRSAPETTAVMGG